MKTFFSARSRSYEGSPRPVLYGLLALLAVALASEPAAGQATARVTEPLTRFRIGSASKGLTSAVVGLLHERGKLELDAPVRTYVPSFPDKRWPINTRQLMGHVADIRHSRSNKVICRSEH